MHFETLMKKAQAGDAEAQYELACLYLDEDGDHFDYSAALEWMFESAENGCEAAIDYLKELLHGEDLRAESYD